MSKNIQVQIRSGLAADEQKIKKMNTGELAAKKKSQQFSLYKYNQDMFIKIKR